MKLIFNLFFMFCRNVLSFLEFFKLLGQIKHFRILKWVSEWFREKEKWFLNTLTLQILGIFQENVKFFNRQAPVKLI